MKRTILVTALVGLLLLPVLNGPAHAQRHVSYVGDNLWLGSYSVGFPMGDTKDYIGQTSWLGFAIEGRHFTTPNLTLGFLSGWTTFNDKSYRLTEEGTMTLSGVQARYLNIFPLLANVFYYLGDRDSANFYFGLGAGTYWIEQRTEVGLWAATENNWHLGLAPEIGVAFPRGRTSIVVSARYNYAFSAGNVGKESWLSLGIGFQLN